VVEQAVRLEKKSCAASVSFICTVNMLYLSNSSHACGEEGPVVALLQEAFAAAAAAARQMLLSALDSYCGQALFTFAPLFISHVASMKITSEGPKDASWLQPLASAEDFTAEPGWNALVEVGVRTAYGWVGVVGSECPIFSHMGLAPELCKGCDWCLNEM
jgi:hypothetical protein